MIVLFVPICLFVSSYLKARDPESFYVQTNKAGSPRLNLGLLDG